MPLHATGLLSSVWIQEATSPINTPPGGGRRGPLLVNMSRSDSESRALVQLLERSTSRRLCVA